MLVSPLLLRPCHKALFYLVLSDRLGQFCLSVFSFWNFVDFSLLTTLLQFSLSFGLRSLKIPLHGFGTKLTQRVVFGLPCFSIGFRNLSWSCSESGCLSLSLSAEMPVSWVRMGLCSWLQEGLDQAAVAGRWHALRGEWLQCMPGTRTRPSHPVGRHKC